ncbi:M3 family peptidase, partial [Mycobacterium tuberculosis]|nr:M3 family peptidase [Mycobacterium tuberculosis]
IYGITAKERTDVDVWHPEVRFFELYDEHNELRGSFYLDLYAREHKRGGAWMTALVDQSTLLGTRPVVTNVLNIARPPEGEPVLLT